MAWIHPETNGDYTIIGVTDDFLVGNWEPLATFDSAGNGNISVDLDFITPLSGLGEWKALLSFDDGMSITHAKDRLNVPHSIYNTNGDIVSNSSADLWSLNMVANLDYYVTDGYPQLINSRTALTGSDSSGTAKNPLNLGPNSDPKNLGNPGGFLIGGVPGDEDWIDFTTDSNQFATYGFYIFSPTISTIGGSISGTLSRESSNIWAIGAIDITDDVDFGGTVDIKNALDGTQTPTFSGNGSINVGPGGSIEATFAKSFIDNGTNNTISGNAKTNIGVKFS